MAIIYEILQCNEDVIVFTKFFEILNRGKLVSISFYFLLFSEMPRPRLNTDEERKKRTNIVFLFYKQLWQVRLAGKNTTVKMLKEYLRKFNYQRLTLSPILKELLPSQYLWGSSLHAERLHKKLQDLSSRCPISGFK